MTPNRIIKRTELNPTSEYPYGSVLITAFITGIKLQYKLAYNTPEKSDGNSTMLWSKKIR